MSLVEAALKVWGGKQLETLRFLNLKQRKGPMVFEKKTGRTKKGVAKQVGVLFFFFFLKWIKCTPGEKWRRKHKSARICWRFDKSFSFLGKTNMNFLHRFGEVAIQASESGWVDWLIDWLIDWSMDWWMDGWMDGWMDWLIDWLIDWCWSTRISSKVG